MKRTHFQLAILAGLAATFALLPQARAELVYEDGSNARVEDRALTRQTLGASEKAQVTLQEQQPQAQAVQQVNVQPAPVATQVQVGPAQVQTASDEVQNLSKSELIRRERLREEMKNEDVLQERLEELRLRDEQRRTQEILGGAPQGAAGATGDVTLPAPIYGAAAASGANGASGAAMAQQQQQPAPVTEKVGAAAATPVAETKAQAAPTGAMAVAPMETVAVGGASSATISAGASEPSDKTSFTVSPRFGLSNMADQGNLQVTSKYAAGVAGSVAASDNLSFEIGYTYSEYGVNLGNGSPLYNNNTSLQTMALKQNVIDASLKLYLLGQDSRIRPFVGVGGGYSLGYLNYNSSLLNYINSYYPNSGIGSDYKINQFLGQLSTGFDVKVARNISVGVLFKYNKVFSSTESNNIFDNAGYYNGYYYPMATGGVTTDKQIASDSLSNASFYTIMAGVNFTF